MATAHGPRITLPPDAWDLRVEADRSNLDHWYRGKKYNFEQLVALRSSQPRPPSERRLMPQREMP
jgi:hypothetical protein